MSLLEIIQTILLQPLTLIFEFIYMMANGFLDDPGLSIIALSLMMNFLVLPLYMRADAMQEEEQKMEAKLAPGIAHIKKTFKGDEQVMMLQTYYRQNQYKPTYVLRSAMSLLLEIPFFIAAYNFLSGLTLLSGVAFGPIQDLSRPDGLLTVAGISVNVLPIVMTAVNLVSCMIFTKGGALRSKIQLYAMALFFLVFLYDSPSGLVFYWTLNNVFSLVKTIFYKLKNPGRILCFLAGILGLGLIVWGFRIQGSGILRTKVMLLTAGFLLEIPLLVLLLKNKLRFSPKLRPGEPNPKLFFTGGMFLTLLIGVVIPSSVISASPQEFVDLSYFLHPNWYIVSSFCLAFGTFVVWFGVFYQLAKPGYKALMDYLIWIAVGCAIINYMFFDGDFGLLSNSLTTDRPVDYTIKEQLFNAVVLAAASVLLFLAALVLKKRLVQIVAVGCVALCCMSALNLKTIQDSINNVEGQSEQISSHTPHFTLSKTGKNVVVIMLDRAVGSYIPYLFNEKPELKQQFDGFTYYSNVISYGFVTNIAAPPLFGGYEYTPAAMNQRGDQSLVSKHNESLLMLPVLFDQSGYNVTVCDPVYSNYQWIPDLSIFDDYPDINTYITSGAFTNSVTKEHKVENNKRNFFCYSLMKCLPSVLQEPMYDSGLYNNSSMWEQRVWEVQIAHDQYTADGIFTEFQNAYDVLDNLPDITLTTQENTNTFLSLVNYATHEPVLLQTPDYVPAEHVDNTAYETANQDRFTWNGQRLKMDTTEQLMHYHINMAALLKLGEWFDYLRENGVYHNTRIILAADHGVGLYQMEELIVDGGWDANAYFPLLMVKDFNSEGFTTSSDFMTNADVPTLAVEGLLEDPRNPFTGNPIDSSAKDEPVQYIFPSDLWNIMTNNGNTFLPDKWYSVHDSIWEKKNWALVTESAVLPWES